MKYQKLISYVMKAYAIIKFYFINLRRVSPTIIIHWAQRRYCTVLGFACLGTIPRSILRVFVQLLSFLASLMFGIEPQETWFWNVTARTYIEKVFKLNDIYSCLFWMWVPVFRLINWRTEFYYWKMSRCC